MADRPSTAELERTLQEGSLGERLSALGWAGSIQGSKRIELLALALGDRNHRVRNRAAEVLGEQEDPKALEVLIQALDAPEFPRRQAAELGLRTMGEHHPTLLGPVLSHPVPSETKVILLKSMGGEAARLDRSTLEELLGSSDARLRSMVLEIMSRREDQQSASDLLDALSDPSWEVRSRAVRSLISSPEPTVVDLLLSCLDHPIRTVTLSAVEILAARSDSGVEEPLAELVRQGSPQTRLSALTVLGSLDQEIPMDLIRIALLDDEPAIRRKGVDLLRRLEDEAAASTLTDVIREGSLDARMDAVAGLARHGSPPVISAMRTILAGGAWALKKHLIEALGSCGHQEGRELLIQSLADSELTKEAARVLSTTQDTDLVRTMVLYLGRPKIGPAVIMILRKVDRDLTTGYLLQGLRSDRPAVQVSALEVLAEIADLDFIPVLEKFKRENPNPIIRQALDHAVQKITRREQGQQDSVVGRLSDTFQYLKEQDE